MQETHRYLFRLTVDDPAAISDPNQTPSVVDVYHYFASHDKFPEIGVIRENSEGYALGQDDELKAQFMSLTQYFPNVTFTLWLAYHDLLNLAVISFKGAEIVYEDEFVYQGLEGPLGSKINVVLDEQGLQLENEISHWFIEDNKPIISAAVSKSPRYSPQNALQAAHHGNTPQQRPPSIVSPKTNPVSASSLQNYPAIPQASINSPQNYPTTSSAAMNGSQNYPATTPTSIQRPQNYPTMSSASIQRPQNYPTMSSASMNSSQTRESMLSRTQR